MSDVHAARIRVDSIAITNYRGISFLALDLEPKLTVLVGRNNAGKSRVLRALALGLAAVVPERDDLTIGGPLEAHIDVVLAPSGDGGFDVSLNDWTRDIVSTLSEDPFKQRISWRTTLKQSAEGLSVVSSRTTRRWDTGALAWALTSSSVDGAALRSLCRGQLIDTGRDLVSELRQRGTPANRLVAELEIAPADRPGLEADLNKLGARLVAKSQTFSEIKDALTELASTVDAIGMPEVRPVPGRLDDLSSVASIELQSHDGKGLPLRVHGTGARSLASLRLQGVAYERRVGADGGNLRPHSVMLVEEPEAHLHPQAHVDLVGLFDTIPGQVVASTHSTHLATEVDPAQLRVIVPDADGLTVVVLKPVDDPPRGTVRARIPRLYASEMEKLRRTIERPFGEILFASAIVIGDGATERALLPPLLRHALNHVAHGVCVVDPGSMGGDEAKALVKAARLLGIPWVLFADGDEPGRQAVEALLIEGDDRDACVVEIPDRATEAMLHAHDVSMCRRAVAAVSEQSPVQTDGEVLRAMSGLKGSTGRYLARELLAGYPNYRDWPEPLVKLVDLVRSRVSPPNVHSKD